MDEECFRPPDWLLNPHLQTILPSLPPLRQLAARRARVLLAGAEEWLLDCGEGTCLQAWHTAAVRPCGRLALLLHGWEGSAESAHVLSLAAGLWGEGYAVVRLNLRDHGATHHLNSGLFHSCRLAEVIGAVRAVAARSVARRLYLAGFSLGGNFLLRVAASGAAPSSLAGVVAISPVLEPVQTLVAMEQGSRLYERYFVHKWCRSLRAKERCWRRYRHVEALCTTRTLRAMTMALVARYTDIPTVDDYYSGYAITGNRLATLAAPACVLAALDDPIIPAGDLLRLAASPRLTIVRTQNGGHCGFIDRPGRMSFADRLVLETFGMCS